MEKPRWADIAIVILTAGILAAAILQTRIFDKQWREMHDSGTDTHDLAVAAKAQADAAKQTLDEIRKGETDTHELAVQAKNQANRTKDIADRALVQAVAIKELADEADRSNDIALGAMKTSERAWVSVEVGEKSGNFAVSMHNSGKTPALKVTYVAAFAGGKRGVIPELDLSHNSSSPLPVPENLPTQMRESLKKEGVIRDVAPTGFVIAPNETKIASDYQGRFLQIFRMNGQRVYVQGRITYDDVFGKNYETLFCYWAELPQTPIVGAAPPSDFLMCNDHNKMD